ncbi:MAG: nicotinamide riboside transporter PnuC, partial [Bacteroidota bacterium]
LTGVITGIICVWLNSREHIAGWFFAIISCALYIQIFYEAKIYGDMLLQVFFIIISVYGWYNWQFGAREKVQLPVSLMPNAYYLGLILLIVLATFSFGYYLDTYTDSPIPYVDASTNAVSLAAQWMMARKYLENWLVWIGVDIVYVGLFINRELYLTTILYGIFLLIATLGYFQWLRSYRKTIPV